MRVADSRLPDAIYMDIIKTGSLADYVFETLENEILSGKYQIGEILTELSISKNSIVLFYHFSILKVNQTPVKKIKKLV